MDEPAGLGERGSAIWQARAVGLSDPAQVAVVTEAARCADRLDELDNIIQGKGVLNLMQFRVLDSFIGEDTVTMNVEVKFNAVMAEARQQQSAFNVLVKSMDGFAAPVAKPVPAGVPADLPDNVTPLQRLLGSVAT